MDNSRYSSNSSLSDVDSLRAKLEEKENILQTAAQYGKDLLDQNRELSQSLEDATRKHTRQIEVLKEENYSLTQRLEQKARMEEEYQEEIESMKKHLASQRDELKVLNELTDQSAQLSELKHRLREMEASYDKLEIDNKSLASLYSSCQEQLEEAHSKIRSIQDSLNDTASDEVSALHKELNDALDAKDELSRSYMLKENEVESLTQQLESFQNQITSLQEELTGANSQLSNLSNSFMASTQENQELRCEIDMLRMTDRDHKKKGNSMFSELDDKRQEAEKKLLLLNVQYESVVNQYDLSKKHMSKLKLQMSNILRMASGSVDSNHVAELESQLNDARNEIQSLSVKLSKVNSSEGTKLPQSIRDSTLAGDHKTIQFVESVLKTKDEELKAMKKELEEKRMSAAYSSQQLNETQHKLRSMESKANKLHAQNIELAVKLEEIKTKYEVEPESETKLERGRVEEIPGFNAEMAQALLGAQAPVANENTPAPSANNTDDDSQAAHGAAAHADDRLSVAESEQSDNQSLSEIHNNHPLEESPTKGSPGKNKHLHPPGLYFTRHVKGSPMSSTDSLWRGDEVCYCTGECQIL